ncbi:DUF805 domain-containing protein [Curtobacterium sp. RRHDQ10]|uniref:DUF805 domain-containing protein n=1 Tax=Curtobacterium phyllosphaerae TaxID=3413379 RepID=UPI003BF0DAEB
MTNPNQNERRAPEFSVPWQPAPSAAPQWGQSQPQYAQPQQPRYASPQQPQHSAAPQQPLYAAPRQPLSATPQQPLYAQPQQHQSAPPQQRPPHWTEDQWAGPAVPTLRDPLYGATFGQAVGRLFRKYRDYSGRASQSEYWFGVLFLASVSVGLWLLTVATSVGSAALGGDARGPIVLATVALRLVWFLGMLLPALGLSARRLQDAGFNRNWLLLVLVPFLGVVPSVLCCFPSNPAGARFDRPRW